MKCSSFIIGNADGMGTIRREELYKASTVLKVFEPKTKKKEENKFLHKFPISRILAFLSMKAGLFSKMKRILASLM